jgi:hypothetical protein
MDIDTYRSLSERERMEMGLAALSAVMRTQTPLTDPGFSAEPLGEFEAFQLVDVLKGSLDASTASRKPRVTPDVRSGLPQVILRLEQMEGRRVAIFARDTPPATSRQFQDRSDWEVK